MSVRIGGEVCLRVEEFEPTEEVRLEVGGLASAWRFLAGERIFCTREPAVQEVYYSSMIVNRISYERSLRKENFKKVFTIIFCYDVTLEIKAFAFIKPIELEEGKFIDLHFLSSDPRNLFGEFRIAGLGVRIVRFLFEKCKRDGYAGVYAEPLKGARSFFAKLGFKEGQESSSIKFSMVWLPAKA